MGWIFAGFVFTIALEILIGVLSGYRKPEEHRQRKTMR